MIAKLQFRYVSSPTGAKYVYALFFLVANFLAWLVRDFGYHTLNSMEGLQACSGNKDCLSREGVLRVSLGCFVFYFIMFVSTAGTSEMNGRRDKWHCGWWYPKTALLLALIFFPFAFPSKLISVYGKISLGGAGVFLLISMASFIIWVQKRSFSENSKLSNIKFRRVVAGIMHLLCVVAIVFLYAWYAPHASCSINISIITGTIILYLLMGAASLRRSVNNAGFLSSGLMGIYVIYTCWCALKSEPEETCMREGGSNNTSKVDMFTIISFVVGLISMAVVTLTTGIDSKCFMAAFKSEDDSADEEDDEVPYGYGFFHFVFATGSMYSAMLLVPWDSNHHIQKFTSDIGWTSTIVRIVNEVVAVILYGLLLLIKRE